MTRPTSVLRHSHDERMYDTMRARSRVTTPDQPIILGGHVMMARRAGWSWTLIADALRCSPGTARRYADKERAHRLDKA